MPISGLLFVALCLLVHAPRSLGHCLHLPICIPVDLCPALEGGSVLGLKHLLMCPFLDSGCVTLSISVQAGIVCMRMYMWHGRTWPGQVWEASGLGAPWWAGGLVCGEAPIWFSGLPGSRLQGSALGFASGGGR